MKVKIETVPFEKVKEFWKKSKYSGDQRWGWGLTKEDAEKLRKLKNSKEIVVLRIDSIPKYEAFEPNVIISDDVRFFITVADQHMKAFAQRYIPQVEFEGGPHPEWWEVGETSRQRQRRMNQANASK